VLGLALAVAVTYHRIVRPAVAVDARDQRSQVATPEGTASAGPASNGMGGAMGPTATALILAGAMTFAAGCTGHGSLSSPPPSPSTTAPQASGGQARADCPPTSRPKGGGFATIDYVDFVQANGRNYIADLHPVPAITRADLGPRVLTVRCSFSQLNERTGMMTPQPRDGDAAFLTPGTQVYAIRGWSPKCRLAASHDSQLHVYLAYRPGSRVAAPEACGLQQNGSL
jgi:hypothetical protein